jgi:hypothetical protein
MTHTEEHFDEIVEALVSQAALVLIENPARPLKSPSGNFLSADNLAATSSFSPFPLPRNYIRKRCDLSQTNKNLFQIPDAFGVLRDFCILRQPFCFR